MREPANYKLRDIVRAIPACAVLIVISFAVLGCSKKSAGTNASGGETTPTGQGTVPGMRKTWGLHAMPGSVFHVEYSPETSIVDLATVGRTLRGVSADHRIFLFEDSPELRAKLVPGKFVLFEGLDLRKVDALALYKGQLVVGTETAPLNEALKSAQVQLKTSVNFGDLFKQVAAEHPVQLPLLYRDPSHYWWNTLNPVVHADISPNNMEGEFEYADQDFAVWKIHYHFYVPGQGEKIPLMEETMLPMSVQISAALLFHPAFTTKEEVAKGGFHLKYTGDEGFKFDGKQTQIEGQGEGDGGIDQSFAFSPFASFGLVVAMAVPRVELRMGTDELWDMAEIPLPSALTESLSDVLLNNTIAGKWIKNQFGGNPLEIEGAAYLQTVISTTAAHSGMQSLVPCQQFTMNLVGQAGVDTTWLGKNSNIKPVELFKKDLVQRNPDSKICGGDK